MQFFKNQVKIVQDLKLNQCQAQSRTLSDKKFGYRAYPSGGLECFNREEIQSQEGLLMYLMNQAGKQLIAGKSVVSISLPVKIFEPRSTLERICDWWAFYPIYLNIAARTNDHIERFKLIVAMTLAGLYNGTKQQKPFNPILGETFEAQWQDGTEIFIEHTSHHPPISHFYILDKQKLFKMYGYYEYQAALRLYSIVGKSKGPNIIEFADGQKIKYELPSVCISGFVIGARVTEYKDTFRIIDDDNQLVCDIKFSDSGSLLSRNDKPTDCFEGTLLKKGEKISELTGSWLKQCCWDGIVYWDLEKIDPIPLIKCSKPLPSDCRFRSDIQYLKQGNIETAQEEKLNLEILQRKDRSSRNKNILE